MKKFLVVFLIAIIVLIAMPMKTNATEPKPKFDTDIDIVPDIVTNKIILLSTDPVLLSALKKGTLGIVTFNNGRVVGFNVEGGYHYTTDFIIITEYPIDIKLTTPVGLKLQKGWLSVYFSKIQVISCRWDCLSIPPAELVFGEESWFSKFIPLQIVKAIPNGHETETNYCCNPPVTHTNYGYTLYLRVVKDDTLPEEMSGDPTLYLDRYFMAMVMVPDYLVTSFERLIDNKDFIWIGLSGSNGDYNFIYFWIP